MPPNPQVWAYVQPLRDRGTWASFASCTATSGWFRANSTQASLTFNEASSLGPENSFQSACYLEDHPMTDGYVVNNHG